MTRILISDVEQCNGPIKVLLPPLSRPRSNPTTTMPSQAHLPRQLILPVVVFVAGAGVCFVPTARAFSPTVFGRLITTSTTTIIMGPSIDSTRRIHSIMEATTAVHDTSNDSNNQNAKALSECTISELWEIVIDSNLMRKGLKSRLLRKQDIIDYLLVEEQQQSYQLKKTLPKSTKFSPPPSVEDKPENDDYPDDFLSHVQLPPQVNNKISPLVRENMIERGITSLLPIQIEAYSEIYLGNDVVLQAPTGSGKTLAYVLPLLSKLSTVSSKQPNPQQRRVPIAAPQILVLVPSRELARQVGKEFDAFAKNRNYPVNNINNSSTNNHTSVVVATVYGGVPIERHVSLLRPKNQRSSPQVIVTTPGRLRELYREGHFEFGRISTVVLDEADILLDKVDSPDIQAILHDLEQSLDETDEYQLILVSATMNQHVVEFSREMEIPPKAMIRVRGNNSEMARVEGVASTDRRTTIPQAGAQPVQHWHMASKASARSTVAIDLISTLSPHLTMVFVASKAEADSVAGVFSTKLGGRMIVRVLHGDMVQSARSRTISLVKEGAMNGGGYQILVTTDVASRGIDLPVDLVIQFGVPRQSGKEGTYCKDLYTHRVGRTGRVRSLPLSPKLDNQHQQGSNAIMLYDPEQGEGKLIQPLRDDIYRELGVWIEPRPLPSASQVVDAAYEKTKSMIQLGVGTGSNGQALTEYFRNRLEQEMEATNWKADELLEYLSRAMVHLSHIDPNYSPFQPPTASLLSASPSDRTIRVVKPPGSATPLSPTEVTRVCKGLGSGKLGKVVVCKDGSIVFDLPEHRARKLVEAAASRSGDGADLLIELPWSLPTM